MANFSYLNGGKNAYFSNNFTLTAFVIQLYIRLLIYRIIWSVIFLPFILLFKILTFIIQFFTGSKKTKPCKKCGKKHKGKKCRKNKC